jgi:hypothetical protein
MSVPGRVPWDQTNRKHALSLDLLTEDGVPVEIEEQAVSLTGEFELGRPPGIKPGSSLNAPFVWTFSGLVLDEGGYEWKLGIDDEPVASRFTVTSPPPGRRSPQADRDRLDARCRRVGAIAGSRGGSGRVRPARAQDAVPHEDIPSRQFEAASGVLLLLVLALRRGLFDPATLGGAFCAAPDLEHVLPWPAGGPRAHPPTGRVGTGRRNSRLGARRRSHYRRSTATAR